MRLTLIAVTVWLALASLGARADERMSFPHFGEVVVTRPAGTPVRVVLFVSGDGGWNLGVKDMAQMLVEHGALVAGIDIRKYIAWLNGNGNGACHSLAGDFENLAHAVEKRAGLAEYLQPDLVGYSSGATLVYAVIAQSPKGTFAGAISLGFCPDLPIRTAICQSENLRYDLDAKGRNAFFKPAGGLGTPWVALQGQKDRVCDYQQAQQFVAETGHAQIVPLPLVGHGYGVQKNWQAQFIAAHEQLAPAPADTGPADGPPLKDLPLIEIPVSADPPGGDQSTLAIIISGDGGWAGLDKEVGAALAERGVPVVGLSSLKYFWKGRQPAAAAQDLDRIMNHYLAAWHRQQVILIGYSFGADVLPALLNRLPAAAIANIRTVNLIGLSGTASFEIHVADWIPGLRDEGEPIGPEVEKLPKLQVQCLYGASEADSACRGIHRDGWNNVEMKGGHHFGGDYGQVAERIKRFAHL